MQRAMQACKMVALLTMQATLAQNPDMMRMAVEQMRSMDDSTFTAMAAQMGLPASQALATRSMMTAMPADALQVGG